jgi:hypothetical protein
MTRWNKSKKKTIKSKKNPIQSKNKTRKQFLFNPKNPSKSLDIYSDTNPKDTIPIHYKTLQDVKDTIETLERLYKLKKYSHKRIFQVGMILQVRLKLLKDTKPSEYQLANRYYNFLKTRTLIPTEEKRLESVFII